MLLIAPIVWLSVMEEDSRLDLLPLLLNLKFHVTFVALIYVLHLLAAQLLPITDVGQKDGVDVVVDQSILSNFRWRGILGKYLLQLQWAHLFNV